MARFYLKTNNQYRVKKFRNDFSCEPDFVNPKTFNEKIAYRMLNPPLEKMELFTQLSDKVLAREMVVNKIGIDLAPQLIYIFDSINDICWENLPEKFVIKCNHDSGSTIICTDKNNFDLKNAKEKLHVHMKMNMYYRSREWQYKDIKPQIICEELIDLSETSCQGFQPIIYRVHCFDSNPIYLEVEYSNADAMIFTNIYDSDWNIQPVQLNRHPNTPVDIPKPEQLIELIRIAKLLTLPDDSLNRQNHSLTQSANC